MRLLKLQMCLSNYVQVPFVDALEPLVKRDWFAELKDGTAVESPGETMSGRLVHVKLHRRFVALVDHDAGKVEIEDESFDLVEQLRRKPLNAAVEICHDASLVERSDADLIWRYSSVSSKNERAEGMLKGVNQVKSPMKRG